MNMEELYDTLYENRAIPFDQFFRELCEKSDATSLEDIRVRMGVPLITMVFIEYGYDRIIQIYEKFPSGPNYDALFKVDQNSNHPVEKIYLECGLEKTFDFIKKYIVENIRSSMILKNIQNHGQYFNILWE